MHDSALTHPLDASVEWLEEIVADAETLDKQLAAIQIAQVRNLAQAGRWAEREAAGSDARTRARDMALRSVAAELGGVTRTTDRVMQARIDEARTIVEDYPATLEAWEAGRITRGHVRVIVHAGTDLPNEVRPMFEEAAIERCERDTPNRAKPAVEMLALHLHPQSFTERHEQAVEGRRVRVVRGRDGMSDLVTTVATVLAEGIYDRLTQQAHTVIDDRGAAKDALNNSTPNGELTSLFGVSAETLVTDARSMDQIRADLFADLLLAGAPVTDPRGTGDGPGPLGKIRARVQIVIPTPCLTGDSNTPVDLVGSTPIDAATARELAGRVGIWERIFTDPVTGTTTAVDSYRVPLPMRRYLQARDQHCRFPGCRIPAVRCEIDHTHDAAKGGRTELCNLCCLCQRHHTMKQFTGWHVKQHPGGVLECTSPTGRVYREDLPRTNVAFTPSEPPDDAPHEERAPF